MSYGNFSTFYTLIGWDNFGFAVTNLGDMDGNGIVDLAVGAKYDDSGRDYAGAVYILTLGDDANVKKAQKISAEHGYFNHFYYLEGNDRFEWAVSAPGDVNNDNILNFSLKQMVTTTAVQMPVQCICSFFKRTGLCKMPKSFPTISVISSLSTPFMGNSAVQLHHWTILTRIVL